MAKEGLTVDDLMSALAQRKFSPVYLFHGEEDFLADEATETIVSASMTPEQQGFNLDVMYGSEADARDIISHASSFPMTADRRVVVVREVEKLPNKELLSAYIEHPSPTTSLILHAGKPDFRKRPYVTAKRFGTVVKFDPLKDQQIPGWISRRAGQQGRVVDTEVAKILAAYVGTSLRDLQNELEKLCVFAGDRKSISADDVRAVVGVSREYDIFELQNAIGVKNLARSSEILSRMLDGGESPILIIVMLTRFFALLWKLSDLQQKRVEDLAGTLGINSYFLKNYVSAVEHYSVAEIEHSFEVLTAADEQLKSSSTNPEHIMQNMLLYLMKQGELFWREMSNFA